MDESNKAWRDRVREALEARDDHAVIGYLVSRRETKDGPWSFEGLSAYTYDVEHGEIRFHPLHLAMWDSIPILGKTPVSL